MELFDFEDVVQVAWDASNQEGVTLHGVLGPWELCTYEASYHNSFIRTVLWTSGSYLRFVEHFRVVFTTARLQEFPRVLYKYALFLISPGVPSRYLSVDGNDTEINFSLERPCSNSVREEVTMRDAMHWKAQRVVDRYLEGRWLLL